MKTTAQLNALIPEIVNQLRYERHEIGDYKDGQYKRNTFVYAEDGWEIEIDYRCTGYWSVGNGDYWTPPFENLVNGWGYVDEISAYHYDNKSEDETVFSESDTAELRKAITEMLKDLE